MPTCCIKQCKSKKGDSQPQLTIHRFPKKEYLRRKWLEVIGAENIDFKFKTLYVCSLHFAASEFNRTLNVVRLRDDSIPSVRLEPPKQTSLPCDTTDTSYDCNEEDPLSIMPIQIDEEIEPTAISSCDEQPPNTSKSLAHQSTKLTEVQEVCYKQRKDIKKLNETVRFQGKQIANMQDMITDLQKQVNFIIRMGRFSGFPNAGNFKTQKPAIRKKSIMRKDQNVP